ncbi:MAG TPA: hypothetical protein VKR31_03070 [Rhizomicrobium sp.]|nr:hypothetical protein [Rhizomicrobium sp.]
MRRTAIVLASGVALLGLISGATLAQSGGSASPPASAAGPTKNVSFCGTVVKLTEDGCIGVRSSGIEGVRLYEITSASPKPSTGELIIGTGTPGGASMCTEGTHLTDVKWSKAAACPLANNPAE